MSRSNRIISTFETFKETFPSLAESTDKPSVGWAVNVYLSNGGILKVVKSNSGLGVVYPSKQRLKDLSGDTKIKKDKVERGFKEWDARFKRAQNEKLFLNAKKLTTPDYWKHIMKYNTDKEYRVDFDRSNMQTELAGHERWGAMFRMFVNNYEYRKRLVETVENSVVYAKDKTLAKNVDILRDFVMDLSSRKREGFQTQIDKYNNYLKALDIISSFVKA